MPKLPARCGPDDSLLEGDVEQACRDGRIEAIHVHELSRDRIAELGVPSGYHVAVKLRRKAPLYIVTRRARNEPRLFRHLERLTRLLGELCPSAPVTLYRDQGRAIEIKT